ncbi:MAG: BPSL0761 family protein [Halomonas sp.]|uniref:BPSL0761 family protein n=1 Tax=Halomonas sp. TaxID=1486246 RepID=UPI003F9C5386
MTTPSERTRAIIQTHKFLAELSQSRHLPEGVRVEAKRLLRHYPSEREILEAARVEQHLSEGPIFQPVFNATY